MCSEIVTIAIGKMAIVSWTEVQVVLFKGTTCTKWQVETRNFKPVCLKDWGKVNQTKHHSEDVPTDDGKEERNDTEETFSFCIDKGGNQECNNGYKGVFPVSVCYKSSIRYSRTSKTKTDNDNHRSDNDWGQEFINPFCTCKTNTCCYRDIDQTSQDYPRLSSRYIAPISFMARDIAVIKANEEPR